MKKKIHFFFHLIWKDINFYSILLLPLSVLYFLVFFFKKKLSLFKVKPKSHTIIKGVLPVPPTLMLPMIIVWDFGLTLNNKSFFFKKKTKKYNKDSGSSKIE